MSKEVNWQQECLKKGFEYVREPDDHYVIAAPAEMVALLRDLLGVDVRTKDGDDYGIAVSDLQEQVDGLVNTLHAQQAERDALLAERDQLCSELIEARRLFVRDTDELIAERDALAEKVEKVRSRYVSVSSAPDAVIPNALDAWGRPVKQHLPYDFSGNPGASATQYCNGWNDSGSYWKAHCVDIQVERDALKKDAERYRWLRDIAGNRILNELARDCTMDGWDAKIDAALQGEQP